MTDLSDTFNVLNLDAWNPIDIGLLSYAKTPIQNTFFTKNSDLIGKALRKSIIYFAETVNDVDRRSCTMGDEFRSTRTHKYLLPNPTDEKANETTLMEVTAFAPLAFDYMRANIGITRHDFQSSFRQNELINFANTGKSGSQMYKTRDDAYIIKTMRDHEAKLLIHSLSGLYLRYSHTFSLMVRYVGLYSVSIRSIFPTEIYCVVMLNNLPSFANIHEIYDLKGSSIGRYASIDLPEKRLKALKDLDIESFYPYGIRLPRDIYRSLRTIIENDALELRKMMITDYSLMLGVHHLDEYVENGENINESLKSNPKPQLGLSSFIAAIGIDRAALEPDDNNETDKKTTPVDPKSMDKFVMKPLRLIACPSESTFNNHSIASSLLGIPGLTHDGRRVLLYPSFIDCLQTFDNFKRVQHAIQNIRDPKRGAEYSVIHPEEYEKRLLKFLFEKVFINSNQTLEELLTSPILPDISHGEQRESFEFIQPLTTIDNDNMFIESTAL